MSAMPENCVGEDRPRHGATGQGAFVHWESAFIPRLEVTSRATHVHYYRHHVHDPLEITWVISGSADVAYRDRRWSVEPGGGFLVAPCEPHAGGSRCGAPFSFVTLHVPVEILPAIAACGGPAASALPLLAVRTAVRPLLDALVPRLDQATRLEEQVAALAATFAAYLGDRSGETLMPEAGAPGHPAVYRIRRILDRTYETEVSVAELADAVHLHERYLISLFKTATGIPPHQYLIARRLEHARRLMGAREPLSTVAVATGFADQSHLTRHFKRTFGVTPGAYQRDFRD